MTREHSYQNVTRPSYGRLRAADSLILAPTAPAASPAPAPRRAFHDTPRRLAKGKGNKKGEHKDRHSDPAPSAAGDGTTAGGHPVPTPEEVLDFADVQSRLAKHAAQGQDLLKKLRSGGRFNTDLLGSVKVQPDRKDGASYPLRELAVVVPRGGRAVSIIVNEGIYVKPILSAIQAHKDYNQQPQRDPDNELELVLKIEAEAPEDAAKRARAVCHEWRERIREVRKKRAALHDSWKKERLLLPDVKRKADTELEKVIKAELTKLDAVEKDATKAAGAK